MLRGGLVLLAAALAAAPGASAGVTAVMPGVTYSHTIEYTGHGPVSLHVVTAPRPGGLYGLQPVLSNGAITGRETVSSIERRVSAQTTAIGINGDFFTWTSGVPTGLVVQGGVLEHHSDPGRSSIGVDASGNLLVDRVSFSGFWRAADRPAHPLNSLNERPRLGHLSLFTPAWGEATPLDAGTFEATLSPFPSAHQGDLVGTVIGASARGGTLIPLDGAVLVARGGTAAAALQAEAQVGTQLTVRLALKPAAWSGIVDAIGGGPALVRDGKPIFRSVEQLTADQLFGRDPRAAVGQRADGSIVLVAVDGRRPWFSVGITNYDLARTLVRLGCVTGSAVDSGGSVTVAFDGKVLNRPSDSYGERPVAEALLVTYAGVYAPSPPAVLSPNGDGVGEQESLAYKVVRPSTVTARLLGPDGVVLELDAGAKQPGTYRVQWGGQTPASAVGPEGRWRWHVEASDDLGRQSSIDRPFSLNTTLGFAVVAPSRVRTGRPVKVGFTLARPATIRVTIETTAGEILRRVAAGERTAGRVTVRWDGRDGRKRRLPRGLYAVRVAATNEVGLTQQLLALVVR